MTQTQYLYPPNVPHVDQQWEGGGDPSQSLQNAIETAIRNLSYYRRQADPDGRVRVTVDGKVVWCATTRPECIAVKLHEEGRYG